VFKNSLEVITLNKPGITDFAKERNMLLQKSKAEWVFFVDSDEVLSKELETEILNLDLKNTRYSGFYVRRKNYFIGQYVGTDKILRLGRRTAGHWERSVHEEWKINGMIGQLKNPLVHTSAKNLYEVVDKMNIYSTLHAKENYKSGKKSNIFKIVLFPSLKFFQSLVMGRGLIMSMLQSFHSFLSWGKEWIFQNV